MLIGAKISKNFGDKTRYAQYHPVPYKQSDKTCESLYNFF